MRFGKQRSSTGSLLGSATSALAGILLAAFANTQAVAAPTPPPATVIRGAVQSAPVAPGVETQDLRAIPTVAPWQGGGPVRIVPRRRHTPLLPPMPPPPAQRDPLLQAPGRGAVRAPAPVLGFAGTAATGAVPPDTAGDVGPNHYIQAVNGAGSIVTIYDKTGNLLSGPFAMESLWTAGGACATGNGDPIVLYDGLADRWLLSEFASTGNHLCVYISQTPDPITGGWYLYDFNTPEFPDYPKYAVWPDAYYVTSNESSPAIYALDRTRMLSGLSATFQRFTAPSLGGFSFQTLTPADLDGSNPPPPGSPAYLIRHRDDESHNPFSNNPANDFLDLFSLSVDFTTPANSTLSGPTSIPVAEFDSDLCGLTSFMCFPQPGTTQTLDPLREVVMWRAQYRNFPSHESLVGSFVTDVDGTDHGGVRWFELRRSGGPWTVFQEGTFAPDAAHRWMSSAAMDGLGNLAVGYSITSGSIFPGIRYAGRLASDPTGQLAQGEATIVNGNGSQIGVERWGDYSSLNVDPSDNCTFWYTNEYIPNSGGNWATWISAFRLACATSAGTIALNRGQYSCSDSVRIDVRDIDLAGSGSLAVGVTTTGGDNETVSLGESPAGSGVFSGTITTAQAAVAIGDGALQVADAETITATYNDANNGSGPAVVQATATTDCTAPVISSVLTTNVAGSEATVGFGTSETATVLVRFGTSCLSLTGSQAGTASGTTHSVLLSGLSPLTTYFYQVEATDGVGNTATDNNGGSCYSFSTTDGPDHYVEFRVNASQTGASNSFPRQDFNLTLDDAALANTEADDPENYRVIKPIGLLNPATKNTEPGPFTPARHYIRYRIKEAKEGIGAQLGNGKFPRAVKHVKRRWDLNNQFGTLTVKSKRVSGMLVPASSSQTTPPTAPGDTTHFLCYTVGPLKGISSTQAPAGKFSKNLQAYFKDEFNDCALDQGGTASFTGTSVQGMCLYDLVKPLELCNPATKTAVVPPRVTGATINGSTPTFNDSLLCYRARLARKLRSASAATLIGGNVNDRISPAQSRHVLRRLKDANQVFTAPGNLFPAPADVDTVRRARLVCIPTTISAVSTL